jgi:hypothetical protein
MRTGDMVQLGDIVDGLMREGGLLAASPSRSSRRSGRRSSASDSPAGDGADGWRDRVDRLGDQRTMGAQARFLHEQIRLKANQALGSDVIATVRIVVRNSR